MNINRNNYETYFLLYIDNELSATDKKAVDEFVAHHEDLHEELTQLQAAILPADDLIFTGKETLLKTDEADKTTEQLLLRLDNELSTDVANHIDSLIAGNILLKAEYNLLQHTKLNPTDEIIFTDKHLLYRRANSRVITGRFIRWAVAAVLVGLGFFTFISITNNRVANNGSAKIDNPAKENNNLISKTVTKPGYKPLDTTEEANLNKNNPADNVTIKTPLIKPNNPVANKDDKYSTVANKNAMANTKSLNGAQQKDIAQKQTALKINNNNADLQIEKISPEKSVPELAVITPKKQTIITDDNILLTEKNAFASTASLTNEKNDNHILFLNEDAVTNTKAGTFLRKLKRTVERKSNIKTGKNLRIAGFEIALN